jgi:hypothetical protein
MLFLSAGHQTCEAYANCVRTRKSFSVLKSPVLEKQRVLLKTNPSSLEAFVQIFVCASRISIRFGIPLQDHGSRSHVSVVHHRTCTRNQSSRRVNLQCAGHRSGRPSIRLVLDNCKFALHSDEFFLYMCSNIPSFVNYCTNRIYCVRLTPFQLS